MMRFTASPSIDAVIRVYDEAGNVIETHEHKGEFKEPSGLSTRRAPIFKRNAESERCDYCVATETIFKSSWTA